MRPASDEPPGLVDLRSELAAACGGMKADSVRVDMLTKPPGASAASTRP